MLFVFGLAGIAQQTLFTPMPNPTLLIIFGGCIGLPAFLQRDEHDARRAKPPPPADRGEEP